MIGREIPITFLESPDIVFSLVPDQDWYLKVDQISPTLILVNLNKDSHFKPLFFVPELQ